MKRYGRPNTIVADRLRSYRGAMVRFRDIKTLQKFASAHASIHNDFNLEGHLIPRETSKKNRSAALAEWR